MKTTDLNTRSKRRTMTEPAPEKPAEIPSPLRQPETVPAQEPIPAGWPHTEPEILPGREPLTAPPAAPPEVPITPRTTLLPWRSIQVRPAKEIRSRYRDCLDEILASCSADGKTTPGAIHDLRVNLKRSQAFIEVIRFANHPLPGRKLKALHKLFTLAGRLRSAQIEYDLVSDHYDQASFNVAYLHQLREHKAGCLHDYRAYLKAGPPRPLREAVRLLKHRIRNLSRKKIIHYLDTAEKHIAHRLKRSIFREQELHLMRKDLKRYYLNLRFAGNPPETIKSFLELLGGWHDRQVAFDHLMKAIHTGHFTAFEREPIQKIKDALRDEKEKLYERIASFYTEHLLPTKRMKKTASTV